jgi:hypothetical protein
MRSYVALLIAALALAGFQARAQQADCGVPAKLDDGWTIAKPEDTGLDGSRLCEIAERLKVTNANVHGVVIVHGARGASNSSKSRVTQSWRVAFLDCGECRTAHRRKHPEDAPCGGAVGQTVT